MGAVRWAALAAVSALAWADAASADVVVFSETGVVPSYRLAGIFNLPLLDATTYEVTFAPEATPLWINNIANTHLDYDNYAEDGQWLGGEGLSGAFLVSWTLTDGVYRGSFTTPSDSMTFWDNGKVKHTEIWDTRLDFVGVFAPEDIGTGYSITLASVPEPATWALMIAGFGLAGAAARRRRWMVRESP